MPDNHQSRVHHQSASPAVLLQAGGWLGRVFMLDFGVTGIDRYITLGSPHAPPPAGVQGVMDQTRGILNYCQTFCPGAHHPEVGRSWPSVHGVSFSQQRHFQHSSRC